MSNYEIRLHYIFYNSFREKFLDSNEFNITEENKCMKYQLFFSFDEFINSFVIEQSENPNSILEHALPGLVNRSLIGKNYAYGGKDFLSQRFKYAGDQGGIIASPSLLGAQLFLAAHSHFFQIYRRGSNTIFIYYFLSFFLSSYKICHAHHRRGIK